MKTAIYIEDGTLQVVLTPETDHEKMCLRLFNDKQIDAKMFDGSFYDCRGGWARQAEYYRSWGYPGREEPRDRSLILKIAATTEELTEC